MNTPPDELELNPGRIAVRAYWKRTGGTSVCVLQSGWTLDQVACEVKSYLDRGATRIEVERDYKPLSSSGDRTIEVNYQ